LSLIVELYCFIHNVLACIYSTLKPDFTCLPLVVHYVATLDHKLMKHLYSYFSLLKSIIQNAIYIIVQGLLPYIIPGSIYK